MLCAKHTRSSSLPSLGQSICVPPVVVGNGSEYGDREWVEVELFQDAVDEVGSFAVHVDAVKGVTCRPHR